MAEANIGTMMRTGRGWKRGRTHDHDVAIARARAICICMGARAVSVMTALERRTSNFGYGLDLLIPLTSAMPARWP